MYQQGDKVNWDWKPRNGYGSFYSVAGVVLKETPKRVKIAIFNLRAKKIDETYVTPACLSPRTNTCEIDTALQQQKAEDQTHRC